MDIHCYSTGIPDASKDDYDGRTIATILLYLQRGGRQHIALWSQLVPNTIWQGGPPCFTLGVSVVYLFSRN